MKTRIKKVQFGDGTVKYYCEKDVLKLEYIIKMICIPILGWAIIPFLIYNRWETISIKKFNIFKIDLSNYDYGVFTNLDDAKAFMEKYKSMIQDKNARETKAKLSLKIIKEEIIK